MTGLEFLRFCEMAGLAEATCVGRMSEATSESVISNRTSAPVTPKMSIISAVTSALKAFTSGFRILTSSVDTNARLNKTWSSIMDFDPQQYTHKFESQAHDNIESMQKWLRDLKTAMSSKPKT